MSYFKILRDKNDLKMLQTANFKVNVVILVFLLFNTDGVREADEFELLRGRGQALKNDESDLLFYDLDSLLLSIILVTWMSFIQITWQ